MNNEHVDNLSSALDQELNEALINDDIANSYEEFLAIFDRFYAQEVEVASDSHPTSLAGKARVLPVLFSFLVSLHVMAEIGGLSVTLRYCPIHSDKSGEQHAEWSLDLLGNPGKTRYVALVFDPAMEGLSCRPRASLRPSPNRRTADWD